MHVLHAGNSTDQHSSLPRKIGDRELSGLAFRSRSATAAGPRPVRTYPPIGAGRCSSTLLTTARRSADLRAPHPSGRQVEPTLGRARGSSPGPGRAPPGGPCRSPHKRLGEPAPAGPRGSTTPSDEPVRRTELRIRARLPARPNRGTNRRNQAVMSYDAYRLYQIERVKGPGEVLTADERAARQPRSPRRRRSSASSPSPPNAAGAGCAYCPRPAPPTTLTTWPRPPTAPSSRS
jgi:hypothetical protein